MKISFNNTNTNTIIIRTMMIVVAMMTITTMFHNVNAFLPTSFSTCTTTPSSFVVTRTNNDNSNTATTSNYRTNRLLSTSNTNNVLKMVKERGEGYGAPLNNVSELIGNTPMIKLSDKMTGTPDVTVYAKAEFSNPLSSVKDRLALSIIESAERDGTLKPGDTVVEATSGNTGIAVAMMCAQRGYDCVITMAEPFSIERRKLMRMLGAKVIVTPKAGKGTGMVEKAAELAKKHGWFLCHQFETDANWKIHEETTGPEILNDLSLVDKKLDYWVTGYGTGGTFHGAGKYIKSKSPDTKIVLSEPASAALVDSGIKTERKEDGSPASSHPAFAAHPIQGWTPDFIPLVLEKGLDLAMLDEYVSIPDGAAVTTSQKLAKMDGILTGISGGATVYAAIETAKKASPGSTIVCMLPDTGERYLSTPLFASIDADMNEEELTIARSTPSFILEPKK